MALTSTLFTGLSGMSVNQSRLNVIGNNIANVNTTAFKASRALFRPQFYVTDGAGSPPNAEFGGTNPNQRGLGATVGTIQKNFKTGAIETTGQATDMAIDGDGFFVVQGADGDRYTRDGSFLLNENNELVTTRGEFVKGYGVDDQFNIVPGSLEKLTVPIGGLTAAEATTAADFKGNLNADGAVAASASKLWSEPLTTAAAAAPTGATPLVDLRRADTPAAAMFADGQKLLFNGKRGTDAVRTQDQGPYEFTIDATTTVDDLNAFFQKSLGIDTSTDVDTAAPADFKPGTSVQSPAGDPPNTARLEIIGNVGGPNALSVSGQDFLIEGGQVPFTFDDQTEGAPVGEGTKTLMEAYDSLGNPIRVNLYTTLESKADSGNTWRFFATSAEDTDAAKAFDPTAADNGAILGSGTLTFDTSGKLKSSTGNGITISRTDTGAATPMSIDLDFSRLTSLSTKDAKSSLIMDSQNGLKTGQLENFSVGDEGTITGVFSNGLKRTLGQIALATFDNPQGLVDEGANNYMTGASSGQPIITAPGSFNAGLVKSGALEQSNVDLSKEFIEMIITSTGFSASSRVITTSDRLLTELLQTSR
jgi:flagellar hook protein FlgE